MHLARLLPAALAHWQSTDPALARLARAQDVHPPLPRGTPFGALARSLLHQQVSVAAGETISRRLTAACHGRVTPEAVLALGEAGMQACGISRQKRSYLVDLATKVRDGTIDFPSLRKADDAAVIEALTQVRGIGEWTAQMFLIFHLGRPDVVAPDDLGLRLAVRDAYGVRIDRTRRFLERRAPDWSPFGSLACLTLWASRRVATNGAHPRPKSETTLRRSRSKP